MLPELISAARVMDDIFRLQSDARGSCFYPPGMTREEFDSAAAYPGLAGLFRSPYTLIRRDPQGRLCAEPYHVAYRPHLERAAAHLERAAGLAEDGAQRRYLELRARALVTDDYPPSDLAWLDMKSNTLDIVIGPIESYEDQLFGCKRAYEACVLVKDRSWSLRLARFVERLEDLQRALPVPPAYKSEPAGLDSEINVYDAIYCAGDANAGPKTMAIHLPNDAPMDAEGRRKGTRRLQLANIMRAKFETILLPIADALIAPGQRPHVRFDAFFDHTMFHETAHGLGVRNTITGRGAVHEALREHHSVLEEAKADLLGLWIIARLLDEGELGTADPLHYYATFLAGIFRSARFGAGSAHGAANVLYFRWLREAGALTRDAAGRFAAVPARMRPAIEELCTKILRMQGDGDYGEADRFVRSYRTPDSVLLSGLDALAGDSIPVDLVFEQD